MRSRDRHPAVFLPGIGSLATDPLSEMAHRYEFVLVANPALYTPLVDAGAQPILLSRGFSETDARGRNRLKLGPVIEPWRWRRVLMNENVDRLTIRWGTGALAMIVGAILAGTRWRIRNH